MKNTLIAELIELADELDELDPKTADRIDEIIKRAGNYPDWSAKETSSKAYQLFEQFRDGKLTKDQYQAELKKLQEQQKQQSEILQPQGKPQ